MTVPLGHAADLVMLVPTGLFLLWLVVTTARNKLRNNRQETDR